MAIFLVRSNITTISMVLDIVSYIIIIGGVRIVSKEISQESSIGHILTHIVLGVYCIYYNARSKILLGTCLGIYRIYNLLLGYNLAQIIHLILLLQLHFNCPMCPKILLILNWNLQEIGDIFLGSCCHVVFEAIFYQYYLMAWDTQKKYC